MCYICVNFYLYSTILDSELTRLGEASLPSTISVIFIFIVTVPPTLVKLISNHSFAVKNFGEVNITGPLPTKIQCF